jgi:membrane protein required for colicin V production
MNWADYTILTIIGLSALISLVRGFVREAISLATLLAAFWAAAQFSPHVAALLVNKITVPSVRLGVAFGIVFVATMLAGGLVNYLAGLLVRKTGLSGTDRMLGLLFGILRGAAIVTLLVLVAGMTPLPKDPWWHESQLLAHFQALALMVRDLLPPDMAHKFSFQ